MILRRFEDNDAVDCFESLSDEETCLLDGGYQSFDKMDDEYNRLMDTFKKQETRYMIVLKEENKVIGTINLMDINDRCVETMEVGYEVSPNYRRKGYAYEAISSLLKFLLDDLHLDMVIAGIFEENTKSIKMLEKLGFSVEGRKHNALWVHNKGPVDLFYYYLERSRN